MNIRQVKNNRRYIFTKIINIHTDIDKVLFDKKIFKIIDHYGSSNNTLRMNIQGRYGFDYTASDNIELYDINYLVKLYNNILETKYVEGENNGKSSRRRITKKTTHS